MKKNVFKSRCTDVNGLYYIFLLLIAHFEQLIDLNNNNNNNFLLKNISSNSLTVPKT